MELKFHTRSWVFKFWVKIYWTKYLPSCKVVPMFKKNIKAVTLFLIISMIAVNTEFWHEEDHLTNIYSSFISFMQSWHKYFFGFWFLFSVLFICCSKFGENPTQDFLWARGQMKVELISWTFLALNAKRFLPMKLQLNFVLQQSREYFTKHFHYFYRK